MTRDFLSFHDGTFPHLVLISDESTASEKPQSREPHSPWGQLSQVLSYVVLCGWLIWLAATEKSESVLASKLDQIIFADFFGYFMISLLFGGAERSVRWQWPLPADEGFRIAGYGAVILFGGWFMEGIAGWQLTIAWMFGLLMSLTDIASLRTGALLRVIWAIVSAFPVALAGSLAGVPEEALFDRHVPSLFAWGLLYFGGIVIFRVVRLWSVMAKRA